MRGRLGGQRLGKLLRCPRVHLCFAGSFSKVCGRYSVNFVIRLNTMNVYISIHLSIHLFYINNGFFVA